MKLTPIFVAFALSPCDKAIATRADGVHIIAERTAWKSGYDLIYISNDMQKNVARYVDKSKEDFFKLLRIDGIEHDHSVWEPLTDTVSEKLLCKPTTNLDDEVLKDLLEDALLCEGEHHKQWYLWKLVDMLEIDMADIDDDDIDRGIAP